MNYCQYCSKYLSIGEMAYSCNECAQAMAARMSYTPPPNFCIKCDDPESLCQCEERCPHDDMMEGCCLTCGMDMREDLAERAHDYAKGLSDN